MIPPKITESVPEPPKIWPPHFSTREQEVRRLMHEGMTRNEIALVLGISPYTSDQYWKNVLKKLGTNALFAAGGISQQLGFDHTLSETVRDALVEWRKGHRQLSSPLSDMWNMEEIGVKK